MPLFYVFIEGMNGPFGPRKNGRISGIPLPADFVQTGPLIPPSLGIHIYYPFVWNKNEKIELIFAVFRPRRGGMCNVFARSMCPVCGGDDFNLCIVHDRPGRREFSPHEFIQISFRPTSRLSVRDG